MTADQDAYGELQALLPDVRAYLRALIPDYWPELAGVLAVLTDEPLGPLATLPLASALAVGGDPSAAVPVAAAWEVLALAARILDDVADQDRPAALWTQVGAGRAVNYCAALCALITKLLAAAPWPADRQRRVTEAFADEALRLTCGQDRDLRGPVETVEDYWQLISDKNAAAFALACAAGALSVSGDATHVAACRTYGYHLGLLHQLFDDFEGMWEPDGLSDLEQGKVTLPLLYALSVDHDRRSELAGLVAANDGTAGAGEIRAILDGLPTREFVLWAALQERDLAVAALGDLPPGPGVAALTDYSAMLFCNLDQLLTA